MSEALKKDRPQFKNIHVTDLMHYRMPSSAKVSILHRISGVFLFLLLPFILWLLDQSLTSEISYEQFHEVASHPFAKLVILALGWSYIHHFCAGIRHLFLDMHFAPGKENAHRTANITLVITILLTLVFAAKLFGLF
jgi:succinate dehydrogenase / fumarate reductase cytochrome b subunit